MFTSTLKNGFIDLAGNAHKHGVDGFNGYRMIAPFISGDNSIVVIPLEIMTDFKDLDVESGFNKTLERVIEKSNVSSYSKDYLTQVILESITIINNGERIDGIDALNGFRWTFFAALITGFNKHVDIDHDNQVVFFDSVEFARDGLK